MDPAILLVVAASALYLVVGVLVCAAADRYFGAVFPRGDSDLLGLVMRSLFILSWPIHVAVFAAAVPVWIIGAAYRAVVRRL
jgi:uncharacterized protein YaaW (UPF0174 family)